VSQENNLQKRKLQKQQEYKGIPECLETMQNNRLTVAKRNKTRWNHWSKTKQRAYIYQWNCKQDSTITIWQLWLCQYWQNQNKHNNECSHDLVSGVPHKESDHHFHHEWEWIAATTPHGLHQVPTEGGCGQCIKQIDWWSCREISTTTIKVTQKWVQS